MSWLKSLDRTTLFLSVFVFLLTFVVYLLTVAPTVTFWDCGELITCSYILGIPHPPGSGLFLMIARIFTLLPVGDEIAYRTNLVSVLFSALTAVIGLLIITKLAKRCSFPNWTAHLGGLVGSLCLAFSYTFWSNAIESEVYALSLFWFLVLLYLTFIWMDHSATSKGDRLLCLISYLGLLSTGVHMTTFLIMPIIFSLIILHDREKLRDPRIWITGLILCSVMFAPTIPTEVFLVGLLGWMIVSIMASSGAKAKGWVLAAGLTVSAFVGYSNQLYIPVRSALDPAIDENDPDNWQRFKSFLERRQYTDQGMIERSFTRRGQFGNQIGTFPRMGFWGFFRVQYSEVRFWFLPVMTGLYGLARIIRARPREGIGLLALLFLSSIVLIWYINFGDGTIPGERLEVRDRDYFFLPAFVSFALVIGLGVSGLATSLLQFLSQKFAMLGRKLAYATSILFLILPVLAYSRNYPLCDHSKNWVAYDFAYNILQSCDKDALLFTNGDNDTFPLWFAQEVEGIRKDVRVINLSLINTDWYIKQLKDTHNVPIKLSDSEILSLRHIQQGNKLYRIQDQMLEHIIDANAWKYPINFASTVGQESRIYKGHSLEPFLELSGLVYRVTNRTGVQMVDVEGTRRKILEEFKYRGIGDSTVRLEETSQKMLSNYLTCYFNLADTLAKAGNYDEAVSLALKTKAFAPDDWRVYAYLVQLHTKSNHPAQAEEVVRTAPAGIEHEKLYFNMGYTYKLMGRQPEYEFQMNRILQDNPRSEAAYNDLFTTYYNQKRREDLAKLLTFWSANNPGDASAASLLKSVQNPSFNFPDISQLRRALQR